MFRFLVLGLVVISAMPVIPAFAEDKPQNLQEAQKAAVNPVLERAKEISDDLDRVNKRHFNVVYGNYNMVHVVETVRESVGNAVKECGSENEDLKIPLETRFTEWKNAVNPLLDEASANIDNMVLAQEYLSSKEYKAFFKLIDKVRADTQKEVKRVPVVTPEACEYLLESMEDTQPKMTKLLEATLISLPRAMQLEDEEERRKQEEQKQSSEKSAS